MTGQDVLAVVALIFGFVLMMATVLALDLRRLNASASPKPTCGCKRPDVEAVILSTGATVNWVCGWCNLDVTEAAARREYERTLGELSNRAAAWLTLRMNFNTRTKRAWKAKWGSLDDAADGRVWDPWNLRAK